MVIFNKKLVFGFSLAEALVSMLVLSIFFLATSKMITQRQPEDTVWHEHGFCACYQGKITCSTNESKPTTKSVIGGQCKLKLPKNSNMYSLALIRNDFVYEREQFINKSITMTSTSFTIDNELLPSDVLTDEDDILNFKIKYSDYKQTLLKLNPKSSIFIDKTPLTYITW